MKCFYKAGEKDKYMMNIFKREKKPYIIAPPNFIQFSPSYIIPIPNSSNRIFMSGGKIVIDIKGENPFENQTK